MASKSAATLPQAQSRNSGLPPLSSSKPLGTTGNPEKTAGEERGVEAQSMGKVAKKQGVLASTDKVYA